MIAPIPLHDAAHGDVPRRNVRTALEPHAGADVLIRLDLESFFPTVTATRVHGVLRAQAVDCARIVTGLCTTTVPVGVWAAVPRSDDVDAHARLGEALRRPHLPQGAPTSPHLANAVAYRLDRRLAALADRFDARYTRYVDDLIFSGGRNLRRDFFVASIGSIVLDEGFAVAWRKTAVRTRAGRQHALGAVVNDRPTLPRQERDRLRATVRNCRVHGGRSQSGERPQFRAELLGRIAAFAALDPARGASLRAEYDRIDWD